MFVGISSTNCRSFEPSHNIGPDRGDILSVIRTEAGNEGRLMYWPLIPSFAEEMRLKYSTSNATAEIVAGVGQA